MTRASQTVLILYGLTFVALAYKAGRAFSEHDHGQAGLFYGLGLVVMVAAWREIGRTHIERPKNRPRRPGPLHRLASAYKARAAIRRESCTCDAFFQTAGQEHDDWCTGSETYWRAI